MAYDSYDSYWEKQFSIQDPVFFANMTPKAIRDYCQFNEIVGTFRQQDKIQARISASIPDEAYYDLFVKACRKSASKVDMDDKGLIWSGSKVMINACQATWRALQGGMANGHIVVKELWGTQLRDWKPSGSWAG